MCCLCIIVQLWCLCIIVWFWCLCTTVKSLCLKGNWCKNAKWSQLLWKCRKHANISICRLLIWFFGQYLYKRSHFCFKFELLRVEPCWFPVYWWREKAGSWRVWYYLPHALALFVTSLIQTAGHHTGSTQGLVFTTIKCQFLMKSNRNRVKNCCVSVF